MKRLLEELLRVGEDITDYKKIVDSLRKDVDKIKKKLIRRAKEKGGVWENFGQKEFRQLWDKYGRYIYDYEFRELGGDKLLDGFRNWIENYY